MKKIVYLIEEGYETNGPERTIINGLSGNLPEDYEAVVIKWPVSFVKRYNPMVMRSYCKTLRDNLVGAECVVAIACSVGYGMLVYNSKYLRNVKKICYIGDSNVRGIESVLGSKEVGAQLSLGKRLGLILRAKLYGHMEQVVLDSYDKTLYITETDIGYAQEHYRIPENRVGLLEYAVKPGKVCVKAPEDTLYLGFLGLFNPETISLDLRWFIEIIQKMVDEGENIRLRIGGRRMTEEQKAILNSYSCVECLGEVASLEEFYGSVDLIFSTVTKTAGILSKVVEAFSFGKSVIGYRKNFDGIRGAEPENNCIWIGSEEDVRGYIEKIITGQINVVEMGQKAHDVIENNYSWDSRISELLKYIDGGC